MNAIRIALIFSLCYVALSQECREQSSRSLEETEQLTAERISPIKGVPVKPVNPIKGVPAMPGKGKPRPQSIEEAEQLTTESTKETEQLIAERKGPGGGGGGKGPGGVCVFLLYSLNGPLIRLASCMSLGMIVTRFAWIVPIIDE